MGTPDFAVPTLQALVDAGYPIKLVVTQPDRPSGRGQKLTPPPVKALAQQLGIEVFQPESLKSSELARQKILSTPCDFLIVIAFGQILPLSILEHPSIAPLNVHASLLPAYRGAAPIARSIMEGDEQTGITIQWMIEALDQGDVLLQTPCAITEADTAQSLHDKLKQIGAQSLIRTLELFEKDQIVRRSQDARVGSYASKLTKEESLISFDQNAFFVHRSIMGLNPWPGAQCLMSGKPLKIWRSEFLARPAASDPGTIVEVTDKEIVVSCTEGCIALTEVQEENRKRMAVSEFLKGHQVPVGLILGSKR
jgi:methionyl-tRNA formyltransferase